LQTGQSILGDSLFIIIGFLKIKNGVEKMTKQKPKNINEYID